MLVVQVTGGSHFPSQQGLNLKLPVNSESAFKLSFNLKILSSFLAPGPSHFTRDFVCERELERDSDKLEDNRKKERDSERLELQQYFILSNAYKLSDARPSAGAATALALVRARLLLLLSRRSPSEASHSGSLRPGSGWQVQVHLELAY